MKAEVNSKVEKSLTYPLLMIDEADGEILLFKNEAQAVVLRLGVGETSHEVGHTYTRNPSFYKRLQESVTLSND